MILLLGPWHANKYHGAEVGILDALREARCKVVAYDYRSKVLQWANGDDEVIDMDGFNKLPFDTVDFVLCPGPGLPNSVLESKWFKNIKEPKILWNSESIRLECYYNKLKDQLGIYHHYFTFDETEIPIYLELGIAARFLPQAFNPKWYRPLSVEKITNSIVFVGSIGGKWSNRNHFLARVKKYAEKQNVAYKFHNGMFNAVDVNRLYNNSKLILNIGLYDKGLGPVENLKSWAYQQRCFEAIGAGKICVTQKFNSDTFWFPDKLTMLHYTEKNLEQILDYGLDPYNNKEMVKNILTIRDNHTYKARMVQMLNQLKKSG